MRLFFGTSTNAVRSVADFEHVRDICSTGYKNIREVHNMPFGADVMDHVSKVWGLDEEGEIQGAFRPTGHPGVCIGTSSCKRLF